MSVTECFAKGWVPEYAGTGNSVNRFSAQWFGHHLRNNPLSLWAASTRALHLMAMSQARGYDAEDGPDFQVNAAEDLACFEETERWHDRAAFLGTAEERLSEGTISITLVEDNRLAFVAWLAPATSESTFGYVRQTVRFPAKTATEYGVYVHPAYRGKGLFQQGLKFMAAHAFDATDTDILLGAVHDDNPAALHGHRRAGFAHIATLTDRRFLGTARSTAEAQGHGYTISPAPDDDRTWLLRKTSES